MRRDIDTHCSCDRVMTAWTCVIAGGADHGTIVQRSARGAALADEIDSAGVHCRALRVVENGKFSQAIFCSPEATEAELNEASDRLAVLLDVIQRDIYRAVTGVADINFDEVRNIYRA